MWGNHDQTTCCESNSMAALVMSALTIGWCMNLLRKLTYPHLRICTYMVSLVCIFQAFTIEGAGRYSFSSEFQR